MMVVTGLSSGPDTPAATADYWSYWPTVATVAAGRRGLQASGLQEMLLPILH